MKITPINLIQGWNALNSTVDANEDSLFLAQANRVQMQVRNEIIFWNNLNQEQRNAIMDEEMTVNFDPITKHPSFYANDELEFLNIFFEEDIKPMKTIMEELLKSQQDKTKED